MGPKIFDNDAMTACLDIEAGAVDAQRELADLLKKNIEEFKGQHALLKQNEEQIEKDKRAAEEAVAVERDAKKKADLVEAVRLLNEELTKKQTQRKLLEESAERIFGKKVLQ